MYEKKPTEKKKLPQELQYNPHKIISILSVLFYSSNLRNFIINFQILFYILPYKTNLCKRYFVFENIVNFISENPLSHSLKMTLGRKPKHVAVMIF